MRERIAIAVCLLVLTVVVALSYRFAVRHNPDEAAMAAGPAPDAREVPTTGPSASPLPPTATMPLREPDPAAIDQPIKPDVANPDTERGRTLYAQNGCATCHAIAGAGNPRHPLDGVGSRLDAEVLRDWILGTGAAADLLPVTVCRRKERFQKLPAEDQDALVAYMVSLKTGDRTGTEQ
jgi:cytochrome c553